VTATSRPTLLLVAHGSADPRATTTSRELRDAVARRVPDVAVHLGFLDHAAPHPAQLIAALPPGPIVLVPLLLAAAFHVHVDIAAVADGARATGRRVAVSAALAPHPLLLAAAHDRLHEAGIDTGSALVLAAAGTSDPEANAMTELVAKTLAAQRGTHIVAAYASAAEPTVSQALSTLQAEHDQVGVLTWLLSPGRFADTIATAAIAAGAPYTAALGPHPGVADALVDRYNAAANAS
jgi:sirohydrochlorin ferrochelatase